MREFQWQKRAILIVLGLLIVVDLGFAYMTSRLSGSREGRQLALATQSRELALVRADVKRASDIRQKTPEVVRQLSSFEGSLLPSNKGYSVVSQEMDEYAKDTKVTKDDMKFREKEVTGRDLTELQIEIAVNGDYNGIVRFLNKVQRSKSVYIIDALEVESQTSQQAAPGTLKVNLHLRTYFRKV
jgi:type IV pilus assembly protein PilO